MAEKKTAEHWFAENRPHADGLSKLRELALGAGLTETLKWGQPCYTHDGRNIAGIGAFKSYFGLWFFEGARLADKEGVLVNAQPGKTQSMRQWRLSSAEQIQPTKIKLYLKEAKALPALKNTKPKASTAPVKTPQELDTAFKDAPSLKDAFYALTPARQREYASYIEDAKKTETRARRLAKITPMVLAGAGLNDKYR